MPASLLTRRRALALGAAGFAALSLGGILPRPHQRFVSWLDRVDFDALVGERVTLRDEAGRRFAGRVVEVFRADRSAGGAPLEQFSVLVRTGLREALPQQRFVLDHEAWGAVELFMVPVVSRTRAIHYEAVVSRIRT